MAPTHWANMYIKVFEGEIRPVKKAAKVIIGLMWPPEMGKVASRRIVIMIATRVDSIRLGMFVPV